MELIGHIRSLRVLCEVEARGSFTAAAEALGLSQSAVSQHVAALERQVGAELVEHGVRPATLTAAGHALAGHGRAVVARVETAEQELAELLGRRQGRLRLGTFPTALATFAPRAIARFRARHPDVALSVVDDHLQRLLPRLRDREVDLALVYGPGPRAEADLTGVPLLDDRYRVLLPHRHRLARRAGPVDLAELSGDPWIGGGGTGSTWFRIARDACRATGFDPEVALGSDSPQAVQAFVAAGLGVAVVPGLAAVGAPPGVAVRELRGDAPSRRIFAVQLREAFPLAAAAAMTGALQDAARRHAAGAAGDRPGR